MHEDLVMRIVAHELEKAGEDFVMRKWTMPGQRDVLYSERVDQAALAVTITAQIDNEINSVAPKILKALLLRLSATIEVWSDFHEIGHAVDGELRSLLA